MDNTTTFNNKIHRIGRVTVLICLISFISLPIILSFVYDAKLDYGQIIQNALPLLISYTIVGVSENFSYAPIIGAGALYTSCVTGDLSNMKVPASKNAMEITGVEPGTEKGDIVSIIAASTCTFVTTTIAFLGMVFLAKYVDGIFNNPVIKPAFDNLLPALFGALIIPTIISDVKINIPIFVFPCILLFILGPAVYGKNMGYILIVTVLLAVIYSYVMSKNNLANTEIDNDFDVE
ncbi:hypothetical protein M2139_002835 [Enterococcus sp. PF1-24]|uniref:hypothetical protein n=1 Tax=unclassified Enterococcus TaxID=2608891 RepID=UPI0024737ECB|nr:MULTISPECIES: hypothetical protein [unclassified Enterococcus]MDH6365803.1 hypothetical protein [Enterococcus sp. PFB1-1]MDH6402905.1 hypothetical protein [Enterococcus sp. PF1-24]